MGVGIPPPFSCTKAQAQDLFAMYMLYHTPLALLSF